MFSFFPKMKIANFLTENMLNFVGIICKQTVMKKILVIEDNREVRENIAEILELSNYEVFIAENGKAGVQAAIKELPDLIVCDIMMPELDGYGVLHLLSKHIETYGIPF